MYYNKMLLGLFFVLIVMKNIMPKLFLLYEKKIDKIPDKIDAWAIKPLW